mmetsp:Transcript_26544/g.99902  ORF Transcript_26544/g.99902 Transcript_26544/m.99902 type:complete len:373 (-) Transcript_26544:1150-2268(-)
MLSISAPHILASARARLAATIADESPGGAPSSRWSGGLLRFGPTTIPRAWGDISLRPRLAATWARATASQPRILARLSGSARRSAACAAATSSLLAGVARAASAAVPPAAASIRSLGQGAEAAAMIGSGTESSSRVGISRRYIFRAVAAACGGEHSTRGGAVHASPSGSKVSVLSPWASAKAGSRGPRASAPVTAGSECEPASSVEDPADRTAIAARTSSGSAERRKRNRWASSEGAPPASRAQHAAKGRGTRKVSPPTTLASRGTAASGLPNSGAADRARNRMGTRLVRPPPREVGAPAAAAAASSTMTSPVATTPGRVRHTRTRTGADSPARRLNERGEASMVPAEGGSSASAIAVSCTRPRPWLDTVTL